MTISNFDDTEIQITGVYFRADPTQHRFESYPKRMMLEGREVSFKEGGLRYLIHKGQQLIRLFDVSDGQTNYRLRLDGDNRWTLVNSRGI
jgi:hypothetical protein